jgi:outer membrane lipoprotein-sorting protein
MKKYLGLAFLSLVLMSAVPQSSNKEAKELLGKATAKLKSYEQLYISFSYNFVNTRVDPPVTQNENGTIAIKGDNYHLNFMNIEQIRSGNKLYTILKDDEEVQVTAYDAEAAEQGLTPTSLLSSYEKGYSYKLGGSEKVAGKTIQYVVLKPVASEEIDKIMIGIYTDSKQLYSVKQWGKNGTELTLTIKTFEPNKKLAAGYFSFNRKDYPNYYISE